MDSLRRGEKIDLRVLNYTKRKELERIYVDDVLRLPTLIQELGLPDVNLPSANYYRELFRYRVDTGVSGSTRPHGAAVALNRLLLNIDPNKSGMDALNPGVSNLMGFNRLKQVTSKSLRELFDGKSVATFDIETTGIFRGTEARSAAQAITLPDGTINLAKGETLLFGSKQLTGINVGTGKQTFVDAIYAGRGIKVHGFADGGLEFLSASEKFIDKLMEADVVAGHNVLHDISTLFETIQNQPAFANHAGVQRALKAFNERRASNQDFVVDTLEYARTYLNDRVNKAVEASGLRGTDELAKFRDLIISEDFMSKIHLGGSTATSSMEAIAVNTNLIHLVQDAADSGDDTAKELIDMLGKGTHVEDTDAVLQSYMAKFIQSEQLDVLDTQQRNDLLKLTDASGKLKYGTVRKIQSKILSARSYTIHTDISDVSHMSETALRYTLTDEGLTNVSIRGQVKRGDIVGARPSSDVEGVIQYNQKTGMYEVTAAGESMEINTPAAQKLIRSTIETAALDPSSEAADNIRSLKLTYEQNSEIRDIERIRSLSIKKEDVLEKSKVLKSLGKTYETYATPLSLGTSIQVARGKQTSVSTFGVGAERFSDVDQYDAAIEQLVQARAAAGNPFYMLRGMSLKSSTILAESTVGTAKSILTELQESTAQYAEDNPLLRKIRADIDSMKYVDQLENLSEVGISHFKGQTELKVFGGLPAEEIVDIATGTRLAGGAEVAEKMFIPLSYMQELDESFKTPTSTIASKKLNPSFDISTGSIKLSYADLGDKQYLNAVFKISEGTREEKLVKARQLAEALIDLNDEKANVLQAAKAVDDSSTQQILNLTNQAKIQRSSLVEKMAASIVDNGIVIGSIEGDSAKRAFESLRAIGLDLSNDMMNNFRSTILKIFGQGAGLAIGPQIDELSEKAAGEAAQNAEAASKGMSYLNEVAELIDSEGIGEAVRTKIRRSKLGFGANRMADFYVKNKIKIGIGGLGLVATGAAYYSAKKYRENRLYEETIKAQPKQQVSQGSGIEDQFALQGAISSFRRDPLVTAGVVGNLDRNKIGHHRMGNDKYNHLYAGV